MFSISFGELLVISVICFATIGLPLLILATVVLTRRRREKKKLGSREG